MVLQAFAHVTFLFRRQEPESTAVHKAACVYMKLDFDMNRKE